MQLNLLLAHKSLSPKRRLRGVRLPSALGSVSALLSSCVLSSSL